MAKDPGTRKSASGTSTVLCRAPVIQQSKIQKIVAFLATEEEIIAATCNLQDMMYMNRLEESIGLKVA